MTRRGIYKNLIDSNYTYKVENIIFYFSSPVYLRKFVTKKEEFIFNINTSLSNRFGFSISNRMIGLIKLYSNIEKRGFLIYECRKGEWYNCLEAIKLNGETLTKQN